MPQILPNNKEEGETSKGFFSAITGAVTGAIGTAGSIVAIVFIAGMIGAFTFVRYKKKE